MADFSEIIKRLNKANDVAIYCHTNPDGDALGSMLALYFALKKKGPGNPNADSSTWDT